MCKETGTLSWATWMVNSVRKSLEIEFIDVGPVVAPGIVCAWCVVVDDETKALRTRIRQRVVADVTQLDTFLLWNFDRTFNSNLRIEKYVVDAKASSLVMTHHVANLIGGKTFHRSVEAHIDILAWRIVRRLTLIEESTPVFAVPEGLILLEMFVEKSVDYHVVSGDVKSYWGRVDVPTDASPHAMIGSPKPEVVANDVGLSDFQSAIYVHGRWSEASHTEEQVGQQRGIAAMTLTSTNRK